jgi:hypothetical protein
VADRRYCNHHPNHNAVEGLGCAGQQAQIAETERGFESGDAKLIEWTACIIKLFIVSIAPPRMLDAHFGIRRQVRLGTKLERQSKTVSAFCENECIACR